MNAIGIARLRLLGAGLALIAVIALTGWLASSDTAYAQAFNPTSTLCFDDQASEDPDPLSPGHSGECDGSSAPGAITAITGTFVIPAPDLQFGGTINFTPPEWVVARDADVPDGAVVAELSANPTLGLVNDGCANRLPVGFDMMDSVTSMSTQIPFEDPEITAGDPGGDTAGDLDDQFDEGADGLPLGVTRYPDYLARILKDPGGTSLTPISRLYGQTVVAGIDVSLNFLLFEPGIVLQTPAGDTITTDPRLGFPSVTVLQAAGDPATEPNIGDANTVTDFCTELISATTTFGVSKDNPKTAADESGVTIRTNPPAGSYNFAVYAVSQRDADGDGWENSLDTCPTIPNPNWNPRLKTSNPQYSGDQDKDSLPDEPGCDPDPTIPSAGTAGTDEDGDRYTNRGDNCPLVDNSKGQKGGSGPDNQLDSDSDSIGDLCDPNPNTPDGNRVAVCLVATLDVGGGGTPPSPAPQDMQPCDPNAALPGAGAPTPTPEAGGATPAPGQATTDTGTGGPSTGVGSLAPVASSIPTWAAIASGLGGAGLLGGLGTLAARVFGIRLPGRRD